MLTARLIGGAGTGKTTELLDIMDGVLREIHDPHLLGFVTFTRAARREASNRAADRFGMKPTDLEQGGWFKTLHSVCYKQLKTGKALLSADAESMAWIQEALQDDVTAAPTEASDVSEVFAGATTDADRALSIWHRARNRLEPLLDAWQAADDTDSKTPDYAEVLKYVERYEQMKRLDGRVDYTDILAAYAGWYCTADGAERCTPEGDVPDVAAWFFDEAQDNSALSDAVARRLVSGPDCKYAYIVGDPFQSIYGWAGADPKHFMRWNVAKERTMPKSYRCPKAILGVGEEILREATDYWDRGIAPADHDGDVETLTMGKRAISDVDPRESWLLLARTNFLARKWGKLLDDAGIPWAPTRTDRRGGWNAPVRNSAIKALLSLQAGGPIDGRQWQDILKFAPCKYNDTEILTRGTKSGFSAIEPDDAADEFPWVMPAALATLGATPAFMGNVNRGEWYAWIPQARRYAAAMARWGDEAIESGDVRVGTIHSVKGAEADNVIVLTTISEPTARGMRTDAGNDEELRVWYVAATRARRRLIWVKDRVRYRKRVPS